MYGTVGYQRRVYKTSVEDGEAAYIYLPDEAMRMDRTGLISASLAEKLAMAVTEPPYRVTPDIISSTCGQGISAGGVRSVAQRLGGRVTVERRDMR